MTAFKSADRPRAGDTVRMLRAPHWEMGVIETFYANGAGGMHVRRPDGGGSWACCDTVEVVRRAGGGAC